jgi:hypothetical protein
MRDERRGCLLKKKCEPTTQTVEYLCEIFFMITGSIKRGLFIS